MQKLNYKGRFQINIVLLFVGTWIVFMNLNGGWLKAFGFILTLLGSTVIIL